MATQYIEKVGGYSEALEELLTSGGQLYSAESKGGANVVVRGCYCTTYWPANSKKKGQVVEACEIFGYDSYAMTGGRLIRSLLKDVIKLEYKGTRYHDKYRKLAELGGHWHYQFSNPGDNGYCVEFDLKSAYFTSYTQLPTALLAGIDNFVEDDGAMERLRTLYSIMPKWMRLQLLGILASHTKTTIVREKTTTGWGVKINQFSSIETGYAFNAAHRAILRTYKVMKRVHEIAGDNIARIHTDSFALKATTPDEVEAQVFNYLKEMGYEVAVKGMGRMYLFDLNTGAIGKKVIGAKAEVIDRFKEEKISFSPQENAQELIERWGHIIDEIEKGMNGRKSIPIEWEQLEIPSNPYNLKKSDGECGEE